MPSTKPIDTATRAAPEAATARDAKALVRRALVREPKMRAKMGRLASTDYKKGLRFQYGYLGAFPSKVTAVVAAAAGGEHQHRQKHKAEVRETAKGWHISAPNL